MVSCKSRVWYLRIFVDLHWKVTYLFRCTTYVLLYVGIRSYLYTYKLLASLPSDTGYARDWQREGNISPALCPSPPLSRLLQALKVLPQQWQRHLWHTTLAAAHEKPRHNPYRKYEGSSLCVCHCTFNIASKHMVHASRILLLLSWRFYWATNAMIRPHLKPVEEVGHAADRVIGKYSCHLQALALICSKPQVRASWFCRNPKNER